MRCQFLVDCAQSQIRVKPLRLTLTEADDDAPAPALPAQATEEGHIYGAMVFCGLLAANFVAKKLGLSFQWEAGGDRISNCDGCARSGQVGLRPLALDHSVLHRLTATLLPP